VNAVTSARRLFLVMLLVGAFAHAAGGRVGAQEQPSDLVGHLRSAPLVAVGLRQDAQLTRLLRKGKETASDEDRERGTMVSALLRDGVQALGSPGGGRPVVEVFLGLAEAQPGEAGPVQAVLALVPVSLGPPRLVLLAQGPGGPGAADRLQERIRRLLDAARGPVGAHPPMAASRIAQTVVVVAEVGQVIERLQDPEAPPMPQEALAAIRAARGEGTGLWAFVAANRLRNLSKILALTPSQERVSRALDGLVAARVRVLPGGPGEPHTLHIGLDLDAQAAGAGRVLRLVAADAAVLEQGERTQATLQIRAQPSWPRVVYPRVLELGAYLWPQEVRDIREVLRLLASLTGVNLEHDFLRNLTGRIGLYAIREGQDTWSALWLGVRDAARMREGFERAAAWGAYFQRKGLAARWFATVARSTEGAEYELRGAASGAHSRFLVLGPEGDGTGTLWVTRREEGVLHAIRANKRRDGETPQLTIALEPTATGLRLVGQWTEDAPAAAGWDLLQKTWQGIAAALASPAPEGEAPSAPESEN